MKNKHFLWIGIVLLISVVALALYNGYNKASSGKTVTVAVNEVKVYNKSDFVKENEVGKLEKGNKVIALEVNEKYTKVKLNDSSYFIDTKYLDIRSSGLTKEEQDKINKKLIASKKIKKRILYTGSTKLISSIKLNENEKVSLAVLMNMYEFNLELQKKYFKFNNKNILKPFGNGELVDYPDNSDELEYEKPIQVPDETPVVKEPEPVIPEPEKPINNTVKSKDTVTYYERQSGNDDFRILIKSYNVLENNTPYYDYNNPSKQIGTMNIGDKIYPTDLYDRFLANELKTKKVSEYVTVSYNGEDVLVKRDILSANYQVFRSTLAQKENWNYNVDAGTDSNSYQEKGISLPQYNAPNSVDVTIHKHDPIYDLLPSGTKVIPTAITNGSTVKPKYGTGASSSRIIPSKGSASADGWVAPTFKYRYYNSPTGNYHSDAMIFDFLDIGFLHNPEVTAERGAMMMFKTNDGSILDANTILDEYTYFGDFVIHGYSKTEAYRTKKMLSVIMPYFFDKQHSNETVLKVYNDFISYADKKPTTTKTVKYNGFSAIFSKEGTDKYRLLLKY